MYIKKIWNYEDMKKRPKWGFQTYRLTVGQEIESEKITMNN